jgi:hypothetical protein
MNWSGGDMFSVQAFLLVCFLVSMLLCGKNRFVAALGQTISYLLLFFT